MHDPLNANLDYTCLRDFSYKFKLSLHDIRDCKHTWKNRLSLKNLKQQCLLSSTSRLSFSCIHYQRDRIVTISLETIANVMAVSKQYKWAAGVLAAIVVAAMLVTLVVFLVKRSDNNDSADDDWIGSRVTDSFRDFRSVHLFLICFDGSFTLQ